MKWNAKFFSELSTRELYEIVRARTEIFLMEQRIICRDFDGVDYDALHCFLEQDGSIQAYLRAYPVGKGQVKIGRVLSNPHGIGLGTRLMRESLPAIRKYFEGGAVILHAQTRAKGFYEKLGFTVTSDEYLEEGVPHVTMFLAPESELS